MESIATLLCRQKRRLDGAPRWEHIQRDPLPCGRTRRMTSPPVSVPFPVSLFSLRGVILNGALRCPVCGGETMRVSRPWGIRALLLVLRCRYRLCRHCFRTWLAWR